MSCHAFILDVDGTLAETEELHRAAFNAAFRSTGLDWHWSRPLYRRLLGTTGGKERIAAYAASIGSAGLDVPAIHRTKNRFYAATARGLELRAGVADLIHRARASGVRLAIATTTSRSNLDSLIDTTLGPAASAWFEVVVCGEDVAQKKPDPECYLKCLEIMNLPASTCIAFEDSRPGLLAATAAGIATVVTPSLYTRNQQFDEAAKVLPDLTSFDWTTIPATKVAAYI